MPTSETAVSPRLHMLQQALRAGHAEALGTFWQQLAAQGAPLVEPIPGDAHHVLVTFLWKEQDALKNLVIIGRWDAAHTYLHPAYFRNNQMVRMLDTDLWYKTYRLRHDLRTHYQLAPNDSLVSLRDEPDLPARYAGWQADPLNPHTAHVRVSHSKSSNLQPTLRLR